MKIVGNENVRFQSEIPNNTSETKKENKTLERRDFSLNGNDALGNYNRACLNMPFKGNRIANTNTKKLTDEEFEEYKNAFYKKISGLTNSKEQIIYAEFLRDLDKSDKSANTLKILNSDSISELMKKDKSYKITGAIEKWGDKSPKDIENIMYVLNNKKTQQFIENGDINVEDLSTLFKNQEALDAIVNEFPELLNNADVYNMAESVLFIKQIEDSELKDKVLKAGIKNIGYIAVLEAILSLTNDAEIISKTYDKYENGLPAMYGFYYVCLFPYINSDTSNLTTNKKIKIENTIKLLKPALQDDKIFSKDEINAINNLEKSILASLNSITKQKETNSKDAKVMMQGFFANNNSSIEELLKNTDFTQYGKKGLPLKYSRNDFLIDIENELKNLDEKERNSILQKLNISLVKDGDKTIGYDGIISLDKLSENGIEGKILKLTTKFIKENSVETGNKELDTALNSLIQGMPEFVNVIGKKQHETQNYSLDIHILTVLKEAMSNSEYEKLSNSDKTCLKFAIIMHDIGKSENVVDENHPETSASYARAIMKKYSFPYSFDDRICELIKNHHWLKKYNLDEINENQVATMFRRNNDFKIAKIMAEADLKGVSKSFYKSYKDTLNSEKITLVENSINNINSKGQFAFSSRIVNKDLIPEVEYKGNTYKVIDFTSVKRDEDLSKYGFPKNTTYDSIRLNVHMNNDPIGLENVIILQNAEENAFLCNSLISLDKCNVFINQKFGVSLESENCNVANASNEDQSSGGLKNFDSFSEIISGNHDASIYRNHIPSSIKNSLGLNDEEYRELNSQISEMKFITQIKDDKTYTFGTKKIKGSKIKEAIQNAEDSLMTDNHISEFNFYNPKVNAFVARVDKIEEIPDEFLEITKKYNLPIYILGSPKNDIYF